jgi:predicted helicase
VLFRSVIDFEKDPILERATTFRDSKTSDEEVCHQLNIPLKKGWNLEKARELIKQEDNLKEHIKPVLYRPFDNRYIFYHDSLVWRTVKKITRNMLLGDNLGLITARSNKSDKIDHFFCSEFITETKCGESTTQSCLFPLYLYPDTNKPKELQQKKRPNFSEDFIEKIEINLGYTPTPETIFYYIYAIFHSPTYRSRYAEFLKIDFPRVPLTSNNELFCQLAEYGEELVALHLMKSPKLNNLITQYTENGGSQIVDAGHPKYTKGAVVINKKGDKFVGVPEQVWNFYIGGYQVCQKWLKDRKGRTLNDDDIQHYQRVVVALKETMELMQLIDDVIPDWPIS